MEKLKAKQSRILVRFLIAFSFCAVMIFLGCLSIFLEKEWTYIQPLIISVFLVLSIIFYLITVKKSYIILDKNSFIFCKGGKEYEVDYKNVIYINEERSLKKQIIYFFTIKGGVQTVFFDKENKAFNHLLKKCDNRLTKEEFHRRYPNVEI